MSEKIPTKFLKLKKLADVPRAEYIRGPSPSTLKDPKKRKSFISMLRKSKKVVSHGSVSKKPVSLTFNAAAWLRVNESVNQLISLVLCYKDSSGEFAVIVDEEPISEGYSLMLSGCVTINSKETPEYIRACIAGLDQNQVAFVDELHVQLLKPETQILESQKTA